MHAADMIRWWVVHCYPRSTMASSSSSFFFGSVYIFLYCFWWLVC